MNRFFVNTIYKILAKGISQGYKTGLQSIIRQSKKDRAFARADVDYTAADKEAIKNFKMNAFKVAGVGSWELEEELKKLGVDVLDNKITDYDSFEISVRQKMLQYGIGLGDQPPSGWIKTNLDHAIKSSISGARWIRVKDPQLQEIYVAWKYKTQLDERVRDEHQILEGTVFSLDDPNGSKAFPPNDWGCRCYEEFLTADEASGEDIVSEEQSLELLDQVPEDFRFNPGESQDIWNRWLDEKLAGMPQKEYDKLETMLKKEFGN